MYVVPTYILHAMNFILYTLWHTHEHEVRQEDLFDDCGCSNQVHLCGFEY